jgi:16S rRNA (uracil1498-N3)-methyltransferase
LIRCKILGVRRRFFVEGFDGATATLRGESAVHLARVLRAERDQLYELSDGEKVWLARVERAGRDGVEFALVEPVVAQEAPLRIQLLLSIVKFDRFEWCLEKAAELGATEIVPLAAARTGRALIAAAAKRARRWEKILVESAQQARRISPPALAAVAKPEAAFAASPPSTRILFSESREAPALRDILLKVGSHPTPSRGAPQSVRAATLAIGPEGGWTEDELVAARAAGFAEASLGANILRTETAVIAALAILNYALGD